MTAYLAHPAAWQESWDRQQEGYLPDREHRFAAMLDAVDAATDGAPPRLLDLAGGTGTVTLRALARFPGAEATVLDQDPVLLAIARASLRTVPARGGQTAGDGDRPAVGPGPRHGGATRPASTSHVAERGLATVVSSDLSGPEWIAALPAGDFDAVLTATALHWLPAERVTALYAEIRDVLRPGGVFVNADHMPDDGLGEFSKRLLAREDGRRDARYAAGAVLSWTDWWAHVATDEYLRPLLAERARIYPSASHSAEWLPPVSWHVAALRRAGFSETGVLWRGGTDAAVLGVR